MLNRGSEREKIEKYLKQYCIEALLDEVLNELVDIQPMNPYEEMARYIACKSKPEIMDVQILPMVFIHTCIHVQYIHLSQFYVSQLSENSSNALQGILITNLGKFAGTAYLPSSLWSLLGEKSEELLFPFKQILLETNPKDFAAIDTALLTIKTPISADLTVIIRRSLSIAACKAAATHNGSTIYRFISSLSFSELCIPLPIVTILSLCDRDLRRFVHLKVFPTHSSSLSSAIESCLFLVRRVKQKILSLLNTSSSSSSAASFFLQESKQGALCVSHIRLEVLLPLVSKAIKELSGEGIRLHIGIDYRGDTWSLPPSSSSSTSSLDSANNSSETFFRYASEKEEEESSHEEGKKEGDEQVDAPPGSKTSSERIDSILLQWKQNEICSVEDPFHFADSQSLLGLKAVKLLLSLLLSPYPPFPLTIPTFFHFDAYILNLIRT